MGYSVAGVCSLCTGAVSPQPKMDRMTQQNDENNGGRRGMVVIGSKQRQCGHKSAVNSIPTNDNKPKMVQDTLCDSEKKFPLLAVLQHILV